MLFMHSCFMIALQRVPQYIFAYTINISDISNSCILSLYIIYCSYIIDISITTLLTEIIFSCILLSTILCKILILLTLIIFGNWIVWLCFKPNYEVLVVLLCFEMCFCFTQLSALVKTKKYVKSYYNQSDKSNYSSDVLHTHLIHK